MHKISKKQKSIQPFKEKWYRTKFQLDKSEI